MYNNVMIPLDSSRFAEQALPYAVLLARASDAVLHIVTHYAESMAADVIAIGARGHRRAVRLLPGSVADKIIRSSPVPVLVCPASRKQ
jgi:nucleotide-binding universal stress UspA family protein